MLPCRSEAQVSAKKLLTLEKERDKYNVEAGEANARYLQVIPGHKELKRYLPVQLSNLCTVFLSCRRLEHHLQSYNMHRMLCMGDPYHSYRSWCIVPTQHAVYS